MDVAEHPLAEAEAVAVFRQLAAGRFLLRVQWIKGDGKPEGSTLQHGIHAGGRSREVAALSPQQRVKLVKIAPQRRGHGGEGGLLRRLAQGVGLRGQRQQQLFKKRGTGKIRRTRIGDAAGMRGGESQQRLRILRRVGRL